MSLQFRRQLLGLAYGSLAGPAAGPSGLTTGGGLIRGFAALSSSATTDSKGSLGLSWPVVGALGFGVAGTGLYASKHSVASANAASTAPSTSATAEDPYTKPSESRPLPKAITLYQYEVCPYCCKVKAALDYYKLPYQVVEVNPLTKGELKWSTYKKVPVVKLDDDVVVDSSAILSRIAVDAVAAAPPQSGAASTSSSSTKGSKQAATAAASSNAGPASEEEEEAKWRKWADAVLVKVMTANIYRNWNESVETFKYITDQTNWSWGSREIARWTGAVLMWQIGKRMPAKYNIEGDLREALYRACDEYVDAVGPSRPFLGGDKPNLADLSVFGILRAIERTGAFQDVMTHSRIKPWYERMEAAVGPSARVASSGN